MDRSLPHTHTHTSASVTWEGEQGKGDRGGLSLLLTHLDPFHPSAPQRLHVFCIAHLPRLFFFFSASELDHFVWFGK